MKKKILDFLLKMLKALLKYVAILVVIIFVGSCLYAIDYGRHFVSDKLLSESKEITFYDKFFEEKIDTSNLPKTFEEFKVKYPNAELNALAYDIKTDDQKKLLCKLLSNKKKCDFEYCYKSEKRGLFDWYSEKESTYISFVFDENRNLRYIKKEYVNGKSSKTARHIIDHFESKYYFSEDLSYIYDLEGKLKLAYITNNKETVFRTYYFDQNKEFIYICQSEDDVARGCIRAKDINNIFIRIWHFRYEILKGTAVITYILFIYTLPIFILIYLIVQWVRKRE